MSFDNPAQRMGKEAHAFNRRTSASRGKLFYRLAQQAVQIDPAPFATLVRTQPIGGGA